MHVLLRFIIIFFCSFGDRSAFNTKFYRLNNLLRIENKINFKTYLKLKVIKLILLVILEIVLVKYYEYFY